MKPLKTIPFLLLFALLALWASGCASQNVNPPQARANTGYVDFHADSAGELYWQVERFDDRTQSFKNVFSTFDPLPDKVLRLAFVPGHYRLQVTFLNRVITQPAEVEVEVQAGKNRQHAIPRAIRLLQVRNPDIGFSHLNATIAQILSAGWLHSKLKTDD